MKKTIAIIPAAGRGSRMSSLTDKFPKAMLPINNENLTIDLIIKNLVDNGITDIFIVGGYLHDVLFEYLKRKYVSFKNISLRYVIQKNINGLPGAIDCGIDAIDKECVESENNDKLDMHNVFIVLGDTILSEKFSFGSSSWVGYKQINEYNRWCLIKTNAFNTIEYIIDKPQVKPNTNKVTVGAYYFTDISLLRKSIHNVTTITNNEFQFSDVMTEFIKYKKLSGHKINNWNDVGEISTFKNSKKNITRYFNSIKVLSNSVIKESSNIKKIQDEISWYKSIPKELSEYVPSLLSYGNDWYEISYIPFDMLQEIYIYGLGNNNDKLWNRILNDLIKCINSMKDICYKNYTSKDIADKYKTYNYKMFVQKTLDRIIDLMNYNDFDWKDLINSDLVINGKTYKSLISIKDKIINKLETVSSTLDLSIIHGDMFFGNMFYDVVNNKLKLIDPRGSWGDIGILGDRRYDIAKLNQSITHNYDFITNEFYILDYKEYVFNYNFFDGEYQDKIREKFKKIIEDNGFDFNVIDFLTGITFLCIVPLHSDNRRNQIMEYLTAIQILNKYAEN